MFKFIKRLLGRPAEPRKPTTYEEAVDYVYSMTGEEDLENPWFHFTGGMAMRNGLGLWDREGCLHQHMLQRFGLCHADDTSMLITEAVRARREGRPYSPDADAERCKSHWRRLGLDPATMERVGP